MVTAAPRASLFEPGNASTLTAAAEWLTGTLLGELAIGLCVIAVAMTGLMMLSGTLPVRRGMRVVLGCFVLLGAPAIASAFTALWQQNAPGRVQYYEPVSPEPPREELPPAAYNPYAGASLRQD